MPKLNWFPGHMNKALRQIHEALQRSDFVLELRDARAPIASANPLLDEMIQTRQRLIVLNKSDLADPQQNERWQQYFAGQNCAVISLSCSHKVQQNKQKLLRALQKNFGGQKKKGTSLKNGGAQWSRAARGLVLGIPNVGKSTWINTLLGTPKLKTEDRAGVTCQVGLVRLNENYSLFDSPGMLWPNLQDQNAAARLTLLGSLREQVVEEEQLLCFFVQELESLYPKRLEQYYSLSCLPDIFSGEVESRELTALGFLLEATGSAQLPRQEVSLLCPYLDLQILYAALDILGRRLQCLRKAGKIDYRRLLNHLLRDFQQGKLGRLSLEHVAKHAVGNP